MCAASSRVPHPRRPLLTAAQLPCLPKVEWKRASVFDPRTYEADLASCDALVSTLGILLEADYKVQGQARPLSVLKAIAENATGSRGNPLARQTDRSYERINRDSGELLFPPRHETKTWFADLYHANSPHTIRHVPRFAVWREDGSITLRVHLGRRHLPTVRPAAVHLDQASRRSGDLETEQRGPFKKDYQAHSDATK